MADKSKKSGSKILILLLIIAVVCLIVWKVIYPVIIANRIRSNMEKAYPGAEIIEITLDEGTKTLSELQKDMFRWYAEDFEDKKYVLFYVKSNDWGISRGIATIWGDVVADSYAVTYYEDDMAGSFVEATGLDADYPEVKYAIGPETVNYFRFMKTSQCASYENFRNAEVICVDYISNRKEAGIIVGFEEADEQLMEEIRNKLIEAKFDVDVRMGEIDEVFEEDGLVFIKEDKNHPQVSYLACEYRD